MINVDLLSKRKNEYYNLKDQVEISDNLIRAAFDKLSNVSKRVNAGYSIDGVSADNGNLLDIENDLRIVYERFYKVILPLIDTKLKQINDQLEIAQGDIL